MFPRDSKAARTRRFSDLFFLILRDVAADFDHATEAQRMLCRRAAMLAMSCERAEAAAVESGSDADLLTYARLSDSLGRVLARLGLGKRLREVAQPDLDHFLSAVATQPQPLASTPRGMDDGAADGETAASGSPVAGNRPSREGGS
jgi:hypothetical protein